MASPGPAERPTSPGDNENTFPSPRRGPPSIISSRMTDIASDDGADAAAQTPASPARSADRASRPGTGKTANSSRSQAKNKNRMSGVSAKGGSVPSSSAGPSARPISKTSRSHVPSLTSNAFFRPLSSQRLQAQRGGAGSRPVTMSQQQQQQQQQLQQQQLGDLDDNATDLGGSVMQQPAALAPGAQVQHQVSDEENARPPPSRGTEATEQETYGRATANTSPTTGHHPAGSLSDSVRPLRKKADQARNLSVRVDKGYKERANLPSPIKSPRSFRSSFLIPGKGDQEQGRHRSTDGAEKLSSAASSPGLHPLDSHGRPRQNMAQLLAQKPDMGKVHQYFQGNTRFLFGGRWQNTRQRPVNIATGVFAVVPCVLFFAFEAPWLWRNVSPAIPIVFAYLTYICISSFIHASVSDPGILPRNLHPFPPVDENEDPLRVGPPSNDWTMIKSAEKNTAAMEVPVKHCRTCNVWRPPRAHHCRLCDNCIETHDHHCVWLNNCVGKRNYRYFFSFVTSATILSLLLIGSSLAQVLLYQSWQSVSFGAAIDHFRVPFALVFIGALALCYPAALMSYHLFLMARGETTREYMNSHKFAKAERYRPFSQRSILRNLAAVLCRPRPPSYYRFKGRYQPGDQRLGARRTAANTRRPRKNSQGLEMQDVAPAGPRGFQGPAALRGQGGQ